jgi:hypothetical protein
LVVGEALAHPHRIALQDVAGMGRRGEKRKKKGQNGNAFPPSTHQAQGGEGERKEREAASFLPLSLPPSLPPALPPSGPPSLRWWPFSAFFAQDPSFYRLIQAIIRFCNSRRRFFFCYSSPLPLPPSLPPSGPPSPSPFRSHLAYSRKVVPSSSPLSSTPVARSTKGGKEGGREGEKGNGERNLAWTGESSQGRGRGRKEGSKRCQAREEAERTG